MGHRSPGDRHRGGSHRTGGEGLRACHTCLRRACRPSEARQGHPCRPACEAGRRSWPGGYCLLAGPSSPWLLAWFERGDSRCELDTLLEGEGGGRAGGQPRALKTVGLAWAGQLCGMCAPKPTRGRAQEPHSWAHLRCALQGHIQGRGAAHPAAGPGRPAGWGGPRHSPARRYEPLQPRVVGGGGAQGEGSGAAMIKHARLSRRDTHAGSWRAPGAGRLPRPQMADAGASRPHTDRTKHPGDRHAQARAQPARRRRPCSTAWQQQGKGRRQQGTRAAWRRAGNLTPLRRGRAPRKKMGRDRQLPASSLIAQRGAAEAANA